MKEEQLIVVDSEKKSEILFEVFIKEETIQEKIQEIGKEISKDFKDSKLPPILIGVLNGCLFFMADLIKATSIEMEMDFIKVSSYHGTTSTGNVRLIKDISAQIVGRDIIIVDDIIDTGLTINFLRKHFNSNSPSSIRIITLLYKKEISEMEIEPDYYGFIIPNRFVIGYGLDYKQKYRRLKDIYVIDNEYKKDNNTE